MDAASILFVLATVGVSDGSQPVNDRPVKSASVLQLAPEAGPVHHTAFFAGQDSWGPNSGSPPPAAAPTYDRYPPPPGAATISSASSSVVDSTQAAVTSSGNALRDGVEAGIQAANQHIQQGSTQVVDATRSASQDLNNQFQGWAGSTTQSVQTAANNAFGTAPQPTSGRAPVSNPFATAAPPAAAAPVAAAPVTRSGTAPPPWGSSPVTNEPTWSSNTVSPASATPRTAALGTVATQTEGNWTSLNSSLAPPPMVAPRLVNTPVSAAAASAATMQPMVNSSGPGFPAASPTSQPMDHSVLAQSQQQQPPATAPASENWAIGWDGNSSGQPAPPAAISGRYDSSAAASLPETGRDRGFGVTAQPVTVQSQGSQPGTDPWATDRSNVPAGISSQRTAGTVMGPAVGNPAVGSSITLGPPPMATGAAMPVANTAPMFASATPVLQVPAGNQLPWVPLMVASLCLAGSIGANLFLGWSYMDARYKYRNLVQKTANKFRRATAAA